MSLPGFFFLFFVADLTQVKLFYVGFSIIVYASSILIYTYIYIFWLHWVLVAPCREQELLSDCGEWGFFVALLVDEHRL